MEASNDDGYGQQVWFSTGYTKHLLRRCRELREKCKQMGDVYYREVDGDRLREGTNGSNAAFNSDRKENFSSKLLERIMQYGEERRCKAV